jgi:hypothetical protein
MSYSFNVRGADKAAARAAAVAELDKVVEQQPIHEADRNLAEKTAGGVLELIGDPADGQEISLSVAGSIYKSHETEAFGGCSLNVNVSLLGKTE